MKIKLDCVVAKTTRFESLLKGEVFKFGSVFLMKTESSNSGNAVDLGNGYVHTVTEKSVIVRYPNALLEVGLPDMEQA